MSEALQELLQMLDERIRALEQLPDEEIRDQVFTMLQLIDRVHRGGIQKIAERLKDTELWNGLIDDPAVAVLMDLYGAIELDEVTQVEQTLDMVRPYIESHGGKLELLGVDNGEVQVRMSGSCENCSGTSATIKHGIEAALEEGFADFKSLHVEDSTTEKSPDNLVQLNVNAPVFRDLIPLSELSDSQPTVIECDGRTVVLIRWENEISCLDADCVSCGGSFARGVVRGNILLCDRSNCAFDLRNGRQLDGGTGAVRVYPISIRNGNVALAVNVEPTALLKQR